MIHKPRYLKPKDKVSIVATAKKVKGPDIENGAEILEKWGLTINFGKSLFTKENQFAGNDEKRIKDLQTAIDDPEIKAIFCARGGYGTTRIIDQINFSALEQFPKWIIGFSDITALLCHLHGLNIESVHATMPAIFQMKGAEEAVESLRKILFGESIEYQVPHHRLNRSGKAQAQIIGGNLSILTHIIGSSSDIDTANKILFIEDIDEDLYRLDRMMVQMKRAGKLNQLAGLLIGHFSDMKDNPDDPFGQNSFEVIASHVNQFNYPLAFGFPVGHEPQNLAIPVSRITKLNVGQEYTTLAFA
ncbi:LD-carboxypeptidase [Fulvivirgaceae bacterium BMA10]|uniref:LD-carboxypeptidase n=1 Tax=Splendidivirga corallicola TaxID=3051826 RepID=A0ABT8KTR4_9BACT|nr:LD-carboxypeptidase [Fulvivirgaceae bacterium BMA10]